MLTDEQKKRITEMRLEGMGYQAIANALGDGVSKGNIRYFCKTRGLVGTPDLIALNYDTHRANPNDNEATRKTPIELTCEYCHEKFISYGNPNRKYCSHDCYIKQRFWTDPDAKVTASEIKKRQASNVKTNEAK